MYPSGWKHYAWVKKTLRRTFVSLWKNCFSPFGRKNNHFFLGKQKFASEFFCPWHKVSTQKEHIFCSYPTTKEKYFKNGISSSHQQFVTYFLYTVNWGVPVELGVQVHPRFCRYVSKTCSFKRSCIQTGQCLPYVQFVYMKLNTK